MSLPRRAGPLFLSSLRQIIPDVFDFSPREFSQSRFYFKLLLRRRKLLRVFLKKNISLKPRKFLLVSKDPVDPSVVLFFKSAKFNGFLRRVGRELDKRGRSRASVLLPSRFISLHVTDTHYTSSLSLFRPRKIHKYVCIHGARRREERWKRIARITTMTRHDGRTESARARAVRSDCV